MLHNYKSDSIIDEFNHGQWVQLATVYDQSEGTVRHFANGVLRSTEQTVRSVKLRFGDVEIGNWRNADGKTRTPIRNLNGRIDELIIFKTPLDNEEILRLYDLGHP